MPSSGEKTNVPQAAETLAVIDIGSNSIRMVVGQVLPDGTLEILERLRRAVRLGQDTFRNGSIRAATMRSAVAILRDYRHVLNTYGVSRVRAVATSAVREATNGAVSYTHLTLPTN